MKKPTVNLLIDGAAALLMLGMLATGFVLRFPLPPGTNKSYLLWGLTRHEWGSVHFWCSIGLLSVILVHFVLHWQWVVCTVARRFNLTTANAGPHWRSGLWTAGILGTILVVFAWRSETGVQKITGPRPDVCPPSESIEQGEAAELSEAKGEVNENSQNPPCFKDDILPILERRCLPCHGPVRQRGGFRVDRYEDLFGGKDRPALVVAGSSAKSRLIQLISGKAVDVPLPERHQMPAREVALLRGWIDAGANWPERPTK